jgi:hypothetical protein
MSLAGFHLDWWLEVWYTLLDMPWWWYLASLLTLAAVGWVVWVAWGDWSRLLWCFAVLALGYSLGAFLARKRKRG